MLPERSAANRSDSLPICRIVTSFGSTPTVRSSVRKPKSDDDANRLMANFLPFRSPALLISGRVTN